MISIAFTQAMFHIILHTDVFDSVYSWLYPLNVRLSLGNVLFVYLCPLIALVSIVLLILKRVTPLECIISVVLNVSIPFLVICILVTVNGGV
jgi:hypothetical protein